MSSERLRRTCLRWGAQVFGPSWLPQTGETWSLGDGDTSCTRRLLAALPSSASHKNLSRLTETPRAKQRSDSSTRRGRNYLTSHLLHDVSAEPAEHERPASCRGQSQDELEHAFPLTPTLQQKTETDSSRAHCESKISSLLWRFPSGFYITKQF